MTAEAAVVPRRGLGRGMRALAVGGLIGPAAFVGAWWWAGMSASRYSAVQDAISRLAAVGTPTRALMTTGFVLFGLGVGAYALALRAAVDGPAWIAAAGTAGCTLAIALLPLDRSAATDDAHAVFAVTGYVTLVAVPLLAATGLAALGGAPSARVSRLVGLCSAALLAASFVGPRHGLFQRAGLTVTDLWIAASSVTLLRWRAHSFSTQ